MAVSLELLADRLQRRRDMEPDDHGLAAQPDSFRSLSRISGGGG